MKITIVYKEHKIILQKPNQLKELYIEIECTERNYKKIHSSHKKF